MAFPMMFPLPSASSNRASQYPAPPPVGIKLVEKKRWSVKRVLLLLLTAVAGYDFCNEFSLGAGTKGPAVQIAPSSSKRQDGQLSWRERSLQLLRIKSTRKAPPLPPAAAATTTTTTTTGTTTAARAAQPANSTPVTAVTTITATSTTRVLTATAPTAVSPSRPAPSRPAPSPVTAVPVREVGLLASPRRSSVSASTSSSVYWQANNDVSNSNIARAATASESARQQSQQPSEYRNISGSEQDEYEAEEKELSMSRHSPQPSYPYLATGLSSPPFVQSTRPWQSPSGFTQLVEA